MVPGRIARLAIVVCIAWVISFALIVAIPRLGPGDALENPDAIQYLALADSIRLHGNYAFEGEPTRMRQPLYPLYLAGIRSIFGTDPRYIQGSQTFLIAAAVALFYLLARRVYAEGMAFTAALLLSLYVPFLAAAAYIMTEALFMFLLVASLYLVVLAAQTGRYSLYAAGGVVLGLAGLCRPIALLLPLVIVAVIIVLWGRHRLKRTLFRGFVLLVAWIAVIMPWGFRNAVVLNQPTVLSSDGGFVLWLASRPEWKELTFNQSAFFWDLAEFRKIIEDDYFMSSEANGRFVRQAWINITNDPIGFLGRNLAHTVIIWYLSYLPGQLSLMRSFPAMVFPLHAATVTLILAGGVGVVVSLARRAKEGILLLSVVAYFLAIAFGSGLATRHLLPITPLYLLFIAGGFTWLAGLIMRRHGRSL